jgi:hypothetical protein
MSNYSTICYHERQERINNDFVRCQSCGLSFVNKSKDSRNKTRTDFTNENKSFCRNFDRNFNNIIREEEQHEPVLEYYAGQNKVNYVVVNKQVQFQSWPPKYKVEVNGKTAYLIDEQIKKLLSDIKAIPVSGEEFNQIYGFS